MSDTRDIHSLPTRRSYDLTTTSSRLCAEIPIVTNRCSSEEWMGSSMVIESRSPNTVAASSKLMRCFARFLLAFVGSHSKYTPSNVTYACYFLYAQNTVSGYVIPLKYLQSETFLTAHLWVLTPSASFHGQRSCFHSTDALGSRSISMLPPWSSSKGGFEGFTKNPLERITFCWITIFAPIWN